LSSTRLDIRLFKGLDALSPWTNDTRRLQAARRLKGRRRIGELNKIQAIEALEAGQEVPGGSDEPMPCPLCRAKLSMKERRLGSFVWGVDSLHYVTAHQIWPDELDGLIELVESSKR